MVKKVDKIDKKDFNVSEEEMIRCKEDPLYFYNTYCTINGEKVKPMTREEWNERMKQIEYLRNKSPLKFRQDYKDCLLPENDVFLK